MSWEREPLDDHERDELLEVAADRSLKDDLACRVLTYAGLRADEFAHLRRSWVNFQRDELRVPPEQGEWTPKTENSARVIPLKDPDTRRVLRQWFERHETVGWHRSTVYRRVTDVADETSIPKKVTPHVLRHTYGTMLASEGATAQYIKQTMGHADLETSQQYIQYSGQRLQEEADRLF